MSTSPDVPRNKNLTSGSSTNSGSQQSQMPSIPHFICNMAVVYVPLYFNEHELFQPLKVGLSLSREVIPAIKCDPSANVPPFGAFVFGIHYVLNDSTSNYVPNNSLEPSNVGSQPTASSPPVSEYILFDLEAGMLLIAQWQDSELFDVVPFPRALQSGDHVVGVWVPDDSYESGGYLLLDNSVESYSQLILESLNLFLEGWNYSDIPYKLITQKNSKHTAVKFSGFDLTSVNLKHLLQLVVLSDREHTLQSETPQTITFEQYEALFIMHVYYVEYVYGYNGEAFEVLSVDKVVSLAISAGSALAMLSVGGFLVSKGVFNSTQLDMTQIVSVCFERVANPEVFDHNFISTARPQYADTYMPLLGNPISHVEVSCHTECIAQVGMVSLSKYQVNKSVFDFVAGAIVNNQKVVVICAWSPFSVRTDNLLSNTYVYAGGDYSNIVPLGCILESFGFYLDDYNSANNFFDWVHVLKSALGTGFNGVVYYGRSLDLVVANARSYRSLVVHAAQEFFGDHS